MLASDFPAWYSAGIYGGIGCALLSALAIATWSLWGSRGQRGQVIGALLVCVIASALDIGPLLWIQNRLGVYGPTLSLGEVGAALTAAALIGWAAPLAAMCWYLLLASPMPSAPVRAARPGAITPAALDDPDRMRAVYAGSQPWGLLAPAERAAIAPHTPDAAASDVSGPAHARAIALTQRLTLIGREMDNDIVLDDDRISRLHAELRWERGHIELADYGSLNGTLVNEQAVRGRVPVRDGDIIALGKRRFRLTLLPAEASALSHADDDDDASAQAIERMETRKTASASGAFSRERLLLRLTALQGAAALPGASWTLSAPVTTIGRDPSCAIPLSDTSISRLHAQVTWQPAGFFIADLQSSNGVFLNGQRLSGPAQLFSGDIVALGDVLFRCDMTDETPPALADSPAHALPAAPTIAMTPTSAPSFHMRIAPEWSARPGSHPRLAPPRFAPSDHGAIPPKRDDLSAS